jgi:hypothetical protein
MRPTLDISTKLAIRLGKRAGTVSANSITIMTGKWKAIGRLRKNTEKIYGTFGQWLRQEGRETRRERGITTYGKSS